MYDCFAYKPMFEYIFSVKDNVPYTNGWLQRQYYCTSLIILSL